MNFKELVSKEGVLATGVFAAGLLGIGGAFTCVDYHPQTTTKLEQRIEGHIAITESNLIVSRLVVWPISLGPEYYFSHYEKIETYPNGSHKAMRREYLNMNGVPLAEMGIASKGTIDFVAVDGGRNGSFDGEPDSIKWTLSENLNLEAGKSVQENVRAYAKKRLGEFNADYEGELESIKLF